METSRPASGTKAMRKSPSSTKGRRSIMAFYMLQGRYTHDAIHNLITKPEDRSKAATSVVKAAGGKLHNYFMSLGEYDFVALMEFPDDQAAVATSMAVAAGGHVSGMRTTKLLTPAEAMKCMELAGSASKSLPIPKGK
jgi:uncharacterized protein with GYD domain